MMQLAGVFRVLLAALLGGLVAKGFITADQLDQIITLVLSLGGIVAVAVWSFLSNRLQTLIDHIAHSSRVTAVVADSDIACASPSPKVIPGDPMKELGL